MLSLFSRCSIEFTWPGDSSGWFLRYCSSLVNKSNCPTLPKTIKGEALTTHCSGIHALHADLSGSVLERRN
jgi:hypothetical protein